MNRNLVLFALFLAILGVGFGSLLLVAFGLILLIPALVVRSRPPPSPPPTSTRQETRRVSPPAKPQHMGTPAPPAPEPRPTMGVSAPQQPTPYQSYSPALFPTSIFPSLSGSMAQPLSSGPAANKPQERDELVEAGAILALLKLILG